MPQQGRLGDKSMVPADSHGCPACPHPAVGPAVAGSPDVLVNGKPALRVGDPGVHAACCGPNTWTAKAGAPGVFINGLKAHRLGDVDDHCGGTGKMVEGSPNVFVGNYASSGPTSEVVVPHDRRVKVKLTDALGRKLEGVKVRVRCYHGRLHQTTMNGETTVPECCDDAVLEVISENDHTVWL